ncbi:MAG: diacylglycerol kinase family protein [Candidatus Woesebacteria bacterium]|jgi:diacylglycerol kinase
MRKKTKKFFKAFIYAFRGIVSGFKERNMKFHGVMTILVLEAGLFFSISKYDWFIVLILIAIVWAAELVNTAVEELANTLRDELNLSYSSTTRARDAAAGAVLVVAIAAAMIGLAIFLPKILALFNCSANY